MTLALLALDGKLLGPWVEELRSVIATLPGDGAVRLNLENLIFADAAGIELLQTATPKRDYYIVQRLGRRMISFRLGPVALAFLAVSGQKDRARIDVLAEQLGPAWISAWMQERKVDKGWIDYYEGVTNHAIQMAG